MQGQCHAFGIGLAPALSRGWQQVRKGPRVTRLSLLALNSVNEASLELDTCADTYALGGSAQEIQDCGRAAIVDSYLGSITCRTVSGVFGWVHPESGRICVIWTSVKGLASLTRTTTFAT